MVALTHELLVDWNNDGDWSDADEDVTANVLTQPGIRCSRGRDQVRSLAPPMAGQLSAELYNLDQDYSPENATSPLVGLLVPGLPVRWRVTYNATTYTLWTGLLDDLPQKPYCLNQSVELPCLGTLSRLRREVETGGKTGISTALYQDITTDVALGYILDAIGWPAGDRVLDTGKTTLLWWWLDQADPWQAMVELLSTEGPGAAIYEDGQGRFVFESRHYRALTARCTTSQATFRGSGAEPLFGEDFAYSPRQQEIVNHCTTEVKVRSAKALAAVWTLGATVTLSGGEVRQYIATASDPFTAAVAPVGGTDYTVTAGSLASATLDRTSGASVTLTLTAGATGATLTGLQLRAQLASVDATVLVAETIDVSASRAAYGLRSYKLPTRAEIETNVAQDFANAIVGRYQTPRPMVTISVDNHDAASLVQALTRQVSDRITIQESTMGLDADFFVEQVALEADDCRHVARFGCEKILETGSLFILDASRLDSADVLGF